MLCSITLVKEVKHELNTRLKRVKTKQQTVDLLVRTMQVGKNNDLLSHEPGEKQKT